jgi:hypothetical protein
MLLTAKTIAESFKANLSVLSSIRTDWTEQYAGDLISRIDKAIEIYLGIDAKKDLRNSTTNLIAIQIPALRDVSFFKTQIDDDFRNDPSKRDEILKVLGFAKHLKNVQKSNQEALIQLLYSFKTNMNETLRKEITSKGMNGSLIDNIISYADAFRQANVTQENYKVSTKEISKEASDSFNAIYDEIIGICKKASNYFHYEPLKAEQFTFNKVLTNLGATRKVAAVDPEPQQV